MATGQQAEPQTTKLMDPVCGVRVDPRTAAGSREHAGRTYYFHSLACRDEFDADPARFAVPSAPAVSDTTAATDEPVVHTDPVCGMRVAEGPDTPHATFDQVTYAFCSDDCRRTFLHEPARYVSSMSFEPGRHAAG